MMGIWNILATMYRTCNHRRVSPLRPKLHGTRWSSLTGKLRTSSTHGRRRKLYSRTAWITSAWMTKMPRRLAREVDAKVGCSSKAVAKWGKLLSCLAQTPSPRKRAPQTRRRKIEPHQLVESLVDGHLQRLHTSPPLAGNRKIDFFSRMYLMKATCIIPLCAKAPRDTWTRNSYFIFRSDRHTAPHGRMDTVRLLQRFYTVFAPQQVRSGRVRIPDRYRYPRARVIPW